MSTRRIIIVLIVVAIVAVLVAGFYLLFSQKRSNAAPAATTGGGQIGALPPASTTTASDVYGNTPTGAQFSIGTAGGTVLVNNFYLSNPPVVDGGTIVIKQTPNYAITYDPETSEFWLAIMGTPFATWQSAAEQDFLATLGVSKTDACKLDVTSGVVYSPGDPNDGKDFPLSFCVTGAFGTE